MLPARAGYDLAAPVLDEWAWSAFWRDHEAPFVRRWLGTAPADHALDAGCGIGTYLDDVAAGAGFGVGLDISAGMLARAKRNRPNIGLVQADCSRLPFADRAFDLVLCARVLSHVRAYRAVLDEFARVLRAGGRLLLTDVHPYHPYENTHVEARGLSVAIESFKHPLPTLGADLRDLGFTDLALREWHLRDLEFPPDRARFAKLYAAGDPAVFFALAATRAR